jgi:sigma-B regulation protein RsbU (phosphoserine phosphatase)
MTELLEVLAGFRQATGCPAVVWMATSTAPVRLEPPGASGKRSDWVPPLTSGPPTTVPSPEGPVRIVAIPGPQRAWLAIGPSPLPEDQLDAYLRFLLPVVTQYLQSALEVEHAANELAERYEEINLLYTITEILGRTVSLEEAASTILREISETVGARRGAILVHDRVTDTLQTLATIGATPPEISPIALDDECSVSARVFRDRRALIADEDVVSCPQEAAIRRGAMLSVPIMWTKPSEEPEPLGVVNLSDRRSEQPFTAGDQKLVTAIATQIGTAIQNARLVRRSLTQERLLRELELAHDLQMKLLPRTEVVAPEAQVAARVVPAESVGGDFYNLFRLGPGRTGVMIGDVSSHGYRAALIMALALSASAIHAQTAGDPGDMLAALLATLREELASTEMFISSFYGVVDRKAGTLRYANTGHPHAYVIDVDGDADRLSALDPPLGMVEQPPSASTRLWKSGEDTMILFTDGVSDARNRFGIRLGEQRVLDVARAHRREHPAAILDAILAALTEHTGATPQRDDLTLVVLKS